MTFPSENVKTGMFLDQVTGTFYLFSKIVIKLLVSWIGGALNERIVLIPSL